jgi:hypothetical protein
MVENQEYIEDYYKKKYLKYKKKYIELKQIGASNNNKIFYHNKYLRIIYLLTSKKSINSLKKILLKMKGYIDFRKLTKKKEQEQILTIANNKVIKINSKNASNISHNKMKILSSETLHVGNTEDSESENIEIANENAEKIEDKAYEIFEEWIEENENDNRNTIIIVGIIKSKFTGQIIKKSTFGSNFANGDINLKIVQIKR